MTWPSGVRVGHTRAGAVLLSTAEGTRLSPAEARDVARELGLRADLVDGNDRARLENGVPRAKTPDLYGNGDGI